MVLAEGRLVGTRIELTEDVLLQLEERIRTNVPEATMLITQAGGGGGGFGPTSSHRGSIQVRLVPRTERQRTNEQISMELRRQLSGIPGVIVRARASGGQGMMRGMGGGGGGGRLSVEIMGYDLAESKRIAQDVKTMLDSTPGIADSRLQREEGRPELAVRVDRDKAALLGMTVRTTLGLTLTPPQPGTEGRIDFGAYGGNLRQMYGVWRVRDDRNGCRIDYRATIEPDFPVPPLVGPFMMRRQVEAQLDAVAREIGRRHRQKEAEPAAVAASPLE